MIGHNALTPHFHYPPLATRHLPVWVVMLVRNTDMPTPEGGETDVAQGVSPVVSHTV
jgi:hypothetical protein